MEYITTLKQFFILEKEEFDKEFERKLKSSETLLLNLKINGYQSFFHYDHFIFQKVIEVEKKNLELTNIFESLPLIAKAQYIRNTLVAEVKNTNELEGVFSSKKDIFELTEDLKKRESNKIGSIVNKYMMLLNDEGEKEIVSCENIRTIYDTLFNINGKSLIAEKDKPDGIYFRKSFVGVFDGSGALIHKGLEGENTIIEAIQEGLALLNNQDINIFIRLALFHFIFEYAHPFYDGNGRLGRYLISSIIKKECSDIFAFRVSSGINAQKNKYYKAFKEMEDIRNRGDLGTFVFSFLDLLNNEFDSSIVYAKNKKKTMDELYNKLIKKDVTFSKSEKEVMYVLIQAHVFSDFGVSIKDIFAITNISNKTIRRALIKFKGKGLISETKYNKTLFYNLIQNNN